MRRLTASITILASTIDISISDQYLGPKTKLYAEELSRANSGSGMPENDDLWRDAGDPWKGARTLDSRQGAVAVGRASEIPEKDHFESFAARETVRFLRTHGKAQPFFAICSFLKPHDPFMPARRFAAMFRPEDMKPAGNLGQGRFVAGAQGSAELDCTQHAYPGVARRR